MRRFAPLLVFALVGCTVNVNQPNLTANTAVGDGASAITAPGPAGGTKPVPPGASAAPIPGEDKAPPDPAGVGTRDQQALKTGIAVEASRNSRVGQTFVAGKDGSLAAVGLRIAYRGERAPNAVLRLYASSGGGPTGQPLAEAPIAAADIGKDRDTQWVVARFEAPAALTAGQKYAWALEVTGDTTVVVGAGDNRSYEAGEGWSAGASGLVWNKQGMDFAFRTYLG